MTSLEPGRAPGRAPVIAPDVAPGLAPRLGPGVAPRSHDELEALLGSPLPRTRDKARPVLHEVDRAWLAASPFCLVATADAEGRCDVSPKGDPPGFAVVLDERTVALPERPGNRRADSLHNVLENPHAGLIFLVPGRGDTLRVNGRARLSTDAALLDEMALKGHRPLVALVVDIEEVFFHCAKAFLRSELWEPSTWQPEAVPSRPEIAKAVERPDEPLEELARYYGPSYADGLYRS